MPFRDIADSEEREILTVALFRYCQDNRIEPGSPEYEDARRLMVMLFERQGHRTVEALQAAIVAAIEREH